MRRATFPPSPRREAADAAPERRAAVSEVARLGWLYGPLNQLAPIVRLAAVVSYLRASGENPRLLGPVMASIVASLALRPLNLFAARLVPSRPRSGTDEDVPLSAEGHREEEEPGETVSTATLRTRLLATHLMQLIAYAALLAALGAELLASGLELERPNLLQAVASGGATALLVFAVWWAAQRLSGAQRRHDLTMADSTKDLASSTEDELLALMPTPQRLAFVAVRCARLLLDTLADVTLFFVFLVNALSDEPALEFYGATHPVEAQAALAVGLAALCFGSQHLRFKGEWLLGLGMGAAFVGLGRHHRGDLRASYVAAALFAILRYLNRTREVRSLHGA